MRNRPLQALLAAAAIVGSTASFILADARDDIRAAGNAFADAIRQGKFEDAKKHAVTDEKSEKFLDGMTKFVHARQTLSDAAVAKFGDEGKTMMPQAANAPGPRFDQKWNDAKIEVNGDTAVVTPKNPPENNEPSGPGARAPRMQPQPVKFRKDGGEWKIDLTQLPHMEQMERGMPMLEKMSTVMSEVGGEIKDGKYQNVNEAKQALHQKMMAAMGYGPGGPGRPGRTPGQNNQGR